jgi:hypothetical protein
MGDNGDEYPDGLEPEQVFPHGTAGHHDPPWRGTAWPQVLYGAAASVVLVAAIIVTDLGDRYDENGVRASAASYPAFWVGAVLLVLVQVAVLARAKYVRSRSAMAVSLAALAFACWMVGRLATQW